MLKSLKKGGAQKSGLNRSILDQGWGEFRRQLAYKMDWDEAVTHRTDRFTSAKRRSRNPLALAGGGCQYLEISYRVR